LIVTFSDLEEVLVIEPNTVTVPPALTVVGVTPSDSWAAGPDVCASAATDNRLRAVNAANHLNENLAIRKISSQMFLHTNRPLETTGSCMVQAA
jgi:hypothetical protein